MSEADVRDLQTRIAQLEGRLSAMGDLEQRCEDRARSTTDGAIKSFNHDLVLTCEQWERRANRVELALWGKNGANGLAGDLRFVRDVVDRQQWFLKMIGAGLVTLALQELANYLS